MGSRHRLGAADARVRVPRRTLSVPSPVESAVGGLQPSPRAHLDTRPDHNVAIAAAVRRPAEWLVGPMIVQETS